MGYGLDGAYIGLLTYEKLADPLWISLSDVLDLQKK
jgi:hypothetical protein